MDPVDGVKILPYLIALSVAGVAICQVDKFKEVFNFPNAKCEGSN